LAGRKTNDEISPAPGERADGRFGIGSADRIVDDIDAVAVRDAAQCVLEIFLRVIDDFVRAVLAREFELLGRGRAGDDAGAHQFPDLDRGEPGAAGAPSTASVSPDLSCARSFNAWSVVPYVTVSPAARSKSTPSGSLMRRSGLARRRSRAAPVPTW